MRYKYVFDGVRQSRDVLTFCSNCKVKKKVKISKVYYLNGLHIESETRKKNELLLDKEQGELVAKGVTCKKCSDKINNIPIAKKITPDKYDLIDRRTGKKCFTIARAKNAGWMKWKNISPAPSKKYWPSGFSSITDAAETAKTYRIK